MECWWLGTARAKLGPRELSAAIGAAHGDDSEAAEALLHDVEELLGFDEFSDYVQRPLGETIARLCKILGLDPDWAVEDEGGWMIRAYTPPLSRFAPPPARVKGALPRSGLASPATGPPPAWPGARASSPPG